MNPAIAEYTQTSPSVWSRRLASSTSTTALPLSLAGRAVLQVDKTASSYQTLLRHLRERSKNTDMDCNLNIRPSRHREEKTQNRGFALHNITDTKSDSVQKAPLDQMLKNMELQINSTENDNQLNLFY